MSLAKCGAYLSLGYNKLNMNNSPLIDRFDRRINYVRISITDRCDFRCQYCMNESMTFMPKNKLLTLEEIVLVVRAFCELGVSKIRITGGEPLVRRNALWLFEQVGKLKQLTALRELTLTTNGSQLSRFANALALAGVDRVNISLDSLNAARFKALTRVGRLDKVLAGIKAAKQAGFKRIKLNTVIMKGRNDSEIVELAQFAIQHDLDIAYIEEMPLGEVGHQRSDSYYASDDILLKLQSVFDLQPSTLSTGGPARYYQVANARSKIGFISPHSHNFCDSLQSG